VRTGVIGTSVVLPSVVAGLLARGLRVLGGLARHAALRGLLARDLPRARLLAGLRCRRHVGTGALVTLRRVDAGEPAGGALGHPVPLRQTQTGERGLARAATGGEGLGTLVGEPGEQPLHLLERAQLRTTGGHRQIARANLADEVDG